MDQNDGRFISEYAIPSIGTFKVIQIDYVRFHNILGASLQSD
jgi:hypothetical protein